MAWCSGIWNFRSSLASPVALACSMTLPVQRATGLWFTYCRNTGMGHWPRHRFPAGFVRIDIGHARGHRPQPGAQGAGAVGLDLQPGAVDAEMTTPLFQQGPLGFRLPSRPRWPGV
jgi:hypothetical protein